MSEQKTPQPNFTQAPNVLFDYWLPVLKEGELRTVLAIIRQTFGWHKEEEELSITRLSELTGMSRKAVIASVDSLVDRGIVQARKRGQSYLYSLVTESNQLASGVVTQSNQQDGQVVTQSNQPYKEVVKETIQAKEKDIAAGAAKPTRPLTEWQEKVKAMSVAIAAVTGDDLKVAQTEKRVGQIAAQLLKAGYTPGDLLPFLAWWKVEDWRGKVGQRPTRELVLSELPRSKNGVTSGHRPSPDKDAPEDAERTAHVKKMQQEGFKYG